MTTIRAGVHPDELRGPGGVRVQAPQRHRHRRVVAGALGLLMDRHSPKNIQGGR